MAEVFLAVASGAEGFQKPVAIKRLLPHMASEVRIARMFLSEARLAMHLSHQNIVQVLDLGRGPEGLYFVMELVNGWDLGEILGHVKARSSGFPDSLVGFVGVQVAAGMAHASRVIAAHRDISPRNILVSRDGEVKVADFGVARFDSAGGTETGSFTGKVPFSAPEVLRGEAATAVSDQFSLGVVLHRLLGRGHPFEYSENLVQYAATLARARPPDLSFVSPGLRDVLGRLLALEPERRYGSWEQVGTELATFLASTGNPASSAVLAQLLRTLELPPPPMDLLDAAPAEPVPSRAAPGEEFQLDPEWSPSGAQLDASGRLTGGPAVRPQFAAPRAAAGTAPREDEPLELALDPTHVHAEAEVASQVDPSPQYEVLAPPRPRRRPPVFRIVLALFIATIGVLGTLVVMKGDVLGAGLLPRAVQLPRVLKSEMPVLQIESEPEGAMVFINDEQIGETPVLRENDFPEDVDIPVKVVLRGYRPWTSTFKGGQSANVEARLTKR